MHNFLKLSFTNIWGLRLNFVDCESFLESNSPDILCLCETNLDDSIDSANFCMRGYFPLIQKDSTIHMYDLTVNVNERWGWKWRSLGILALLDLLLSSDASICSTMVFPPLGNSDHVVVSASIDFLIKSKRDAPFIT